MLVYNLLLIERKREKIYVFEFLLMRKDLKRFLLLWSKKELKLIFLLMGMTRFHNPAPMYLWVQ